MSCSAGGAAFLRLCLWVGILRLASADGPCGGASGACSGPRRSSILRLRPRTSLPTRAGAASRGLRPGPALPACTGCCVPWLRFGPVHRLAPMLCPFSWLWANPPACAGAASLRLRWASSSGSRRLLFPLRLRRPTVRLSSADASFGSAFGQPSGSRRSLRPSGTFLGQPSDSHRLSRPLSAPAIQF
jgi:hypothetical protein